MKQTPDRTDFDTNQVINDVMQAMDVLRGFYARENEALEAADAAAFMSMQEEKIDLVNMYKERMNFLLSNKNKMKPLDPITRKKLQAKEADFAELCNANLEGVRKMQHATERLSQKIRFTAQESMRRQGKFGYGETGSVNASETKKTVPIVMSETA